MPESMVFYSNPQSRARIVRWMLEEIGAPYRTEWLSYGGEMKSQDYLAINPMGKVPALRHGETVITECAAICAYLADAFPAAGLAPDPGDRGMYYRWLFFAAGPLEAVVTAHALGLEAPSEKSSMVGYGCYGDVMDTLEYALTRGEFVAGDRFSAADVYVGSHIGWGLQFQSIEDRPVFREYWERLSQRDAQLRATALDDAAVPATDKE